MSARRRGINIPLIKGLFMGAFGFALGAWGGFTGLGAQTPAAGLIDAMLGLRPQRVAGASAVFGLLASACGVAGARLGGMRLAWMPAVLLAVSAAAGAVAGVRGSRAKGLRLFRKAILTLAMLGALATMGWFLRASGMPPDTAAGVFSTPLGYVLVGFCAGLLSGLFQVPIGVLIIPAVVRLCGVPAPTGIVYALAVAAIAGVLPVLLHLAAGTVPGGAAAWMYAFGSAGAAISGIALARLPAASAIPMVGFGLSGAYLCAWRLWRLEPEEPAASSEAGRV